MFLTPTAPIPASLVWSAPNEYVNRSKEDQNLNRANLNLRTQWGVGHRPCPNPTFKSLITNRLGWGQLAISRCRVREAPKLFRFLPSLI